MTLLAGTFYDPAAIDATKLTSALLAMTALDTTHLRLSFTVPANGAVRVRMMGVTIGSTTYPRTLMGVLEGATVRLRQSPMGGMMAAVSTDQQSHEIDAIVSGLTPGANLTWDAAYAIQVIGHTSWAWGGVNTNAGNNARGGFAFEVHNTVSLLGSVTYDPAVAVAKSGASLLAMTALDTTNLRVTFTAPASGNVYWRVRVPWLRGASVWGQILLGVMEGATIRGRTAPMRGNPAPGTIATAAASAESAGVVTGLTPGNSYTWDAAYGVEVVNAGTIVEYGGPNTNAGANAWGCASFDVWTV